MKKLTKDITLDCSKEKEKTIVTGIEKKHGEVDNYIQVNHMREKEGGKKFLQHMGNKIGH